MTHDELVLFFSQIAAMLTAALLGAQAARKLRLPSVIGELLGGVLLGPTFFGALAPKAFAWLFVTTGPGSVGREAVIKLGMLFFCSLPGWKSI